MPARLTSKSWLPGLLFPFQCLPAQAGRLVVGSHAAVSIWEIGRLTSLTRWTVYTSTHTHTHTHTHTYTQSFYKLPMEHKTHTYQNGDSTQTYIHTHQNTHTQTHWIADVCVHVYNPWYSYFVQPSERLLGQLPTGFTFWIHWSRGKLISQFLIWILKMRDRRVNFFQLREAY